VVADAGGEVLDSHGIGNGHEMAGYGGGAAFGGTEEKVGNGSWNEPKKGRGCVENQRHPGACRCQPSQDAGFAAVRVDDVGSLRTEHLHEAAEREAIFPRMDGPDQFGQDGQESGAAAKQDSSEPSRPKERPETKFTCKPGLACKPNTEAMVFS